MSQKNIGGLLSIISLVLIAFAVMSWSDKKDSASIPTVAIANYGPHASLANAIAGIKESLAEEGFVENKNIKYQISDVSFDASLIGQMISSLKVNDPKVLVTLTTPVSQRAKSDVRNIPIIFTAVTDPVAAGLLKTHANHDGNITGVAEKEDMQLMLEFAKTILPRVEVIGVMYSTAEANDMAMINDLTKAANSMSIRIMAIGIDTSRDIPTRITNFKNKVDFIYVSGSGPIQPALPAIAAAADGMKIPVINFDSSPVRENQVLASFGVDCHRIGLHTGAMVARILKGEDLSSIKPIYPGGNDHVGAISMSKARKIGIKIPERIDIPNVVILE